MLDKIIRVIESEPEYPDPCPELRRVIAEAFDCKDAQVFVLELCRHAVRQTKETLAAKLAAMRTESSGSDDAREH